MTRNFLERRPGGFTLIELLVVIAIISLLVSMLLPSLKKAKDLARKAICMSNLRHLAMGTTLYANDQGALPIVRYGFFGQQREHYSIQNLYINYLEGNQGSYSSVSDAMRFEPNNLLVCPSNPRTDYRRGSYGINAGSTSDVCMSLERADRWMNAIRKNVPWCHRLGQSPALWADRIQLAENPYGPPAETNHRDAYGPTGGYVSHVDGTVRWYDVDEDGSPDQSDTYARNGLVCSTTYIPTNSLFPWFQDGTDTLHDPPHNTLLVGGNGIAEGYKGIWSR